jgi:hypothetical protein
MQHLAHVVCRRPEHDGITIHLQRWKLLRKPVKDVAGCFVNEP